MKKISNKFNCNYNFLKNKAILVTGGTGSFGSAFVKKLLNDSNLKRLVIFSRDEYKQYKMREELSSHKKFKILRFFIGDVRDLDRLRMAFRGVDYVVHAAALKQIETAEYNPFEFVNTNIIGAKNIVSAALYCSVKKVIAISTDKAVNPINLYGATKLAADKVFIAANRLSGKEVTCFSVVRYGNVIGSRGSVIPLFQKILLEKKTKIFPITDEKMTRFWISLDEGTSFVLLSLKKMIGGEIFVPKIPSSSILELIKSMKIKNIKIKKIGIRPGEKIYETLINKEDSYNTFELKNYFIVLPYWINIRSYFKKYKFNKVKKDFEFTSNQKILKLKLSEIKKFFSKKLSN